ncbi:hypothetical protein C8R43DRAFT_949249 [Mycena crocata]|nr:hypothetical protein C8R43DRAFT_949249 [Mycena crocata]
MKDAAAKLSYGVVTDTVQQLRRDSVTVTPVTFLNFFTLCMFGRLVAGRLGPASPVSRRWLSQLPEVPSEFEELLDVPSPAKALDAVIERLARSTPVSTPVSWPPSLPRRDTLVVARQIRERIGAGDVPAALVILRNTPQPHPRLLVHATVHALLRVFEFSRAGALLLSFAERITPKMPRMHPSTLFRTVRCLLTLVPRRQLSHEWDRTALRPKLLTLNHHMVSHPALRAAVALYVQARKIFVLRSRELTTIIFRALVAQREWIPAALMLDLQFKDYQLRKTLPTALREPDPTAPSLSPHDRDHLRRRLALLRLENVQANIPLFEDLCDRIRGVIVNLSTRGAAHSLFDSLQGPTEDADPEDADMSFDSLRPDSDRYGLKVATDLHDEGNLPDAHIGIAGVSRKLFSPIRAKQHSRMALQALTILGALVDGRQVPFGEMSSWVNAVGKIPSSLSEIPVYTIIDGRPTTVDARVHLRAILESYAAALPRIMHMHSNVHYASYGFVRRGLRHQYINDAIMKSDPPALDLCLRTADASPHEIDGYLGRVEIDGLCKHQRKRFAKGQMIRAREAEEARAAGREPPPLPMPPKPLVPPEDPTDAADDTLMPPPTMNTYKSLLNVFLRASDMVLYEGSPAATAPTDRDTDATASDTETQEDHEDDDEARMAQQFYHAPRSPNNPNPGAKYPAHPLDFDAYPTPGESIRRGRHNADLELDQGGAAVNSGGQPDQVGSTEDERRLNLAARVLEHMMHERNPRMPPWNSAQLMQVLKQHASELRPVLQRAWKEGEQNLWDELWAAAARSRLDRDAHARAARQAARERGDWPNGLWIDDDGGMGLERDGGYENYNYDERGRKLSGTRWTVDSVMQGTGTLLRRRPNSRPPVDSERAEIDAFNRRLAARTHETDLETYYGTAEQYADM